MTVTSTMEINMADDSTDTIDMTARESRRRCRRCGCGLFLFDCGEQWPGKRDETYCRECYVITVRELRQALSDLQLRYL